MRPLFELFKFPIKFRFGTNINILPWGINDIHVQVKSTRVKLFEHWIIKNTSIEQFQNDHKVVTDILRVYLKCLILFLFFLFFFNIIMFIYKELSCCKMHVQWSKISLRRRKKKTLFYGPDRPVFLILEIFFFQFAKIL